MGGADLHAERLALAARNANRPAEALEALLTLEPDGGWIRDRSVY